MEPIQVAEHGHGRGPVFVLHGGPGAAGSAAPLARALGAHFHVFEPWQREGGAGASSVERHIDDLAQAIEMRCEAQPVALVGESWGAMLSLAFAAQHPGRVLAIALVGCGTFDPKARAHLGATLAQRTTAQLQAALHALEESEADPAARFEAAHRLRAPLYTYARDPEAETPPRLRFDLPGHLESWNDMVRLQEAGVYPAAFSRVSCPVLMLHGDFDPHPGALIRDGLTPHLPQLEYREFERCGHDPLAERHARAPFLAKLGAWLAKQWEAGREGIDSGAQPSTLGGRSQG